MMISIYNMQNYNLHVKSSQNTAHIPCHSSKNAAIIHLYNENVYTKCLQMPKFYTPKQYYLM